MTGKFSNRRIKLTSLGLNRFIGQLVWSYQSFSMSLSRRILFPGIAPFLQRRAVALPFPNRVKEFLGTRLQSDGPSYETLIFIYLRREVRRYSLYSSSFSEHPAGPFTIHFWAPTFKWGISLANIADLSRPADKISLEQQCGNQCHLHSISIALIYMAFDEDTWDYWNGMKYGSSLTLSFQL